MTLATVRGWVRDARRIALLSGAGMSAESGVPTFRDAQTGLWARFRPEELATEDAFRAHPSNVWDWYAMRREMVGKVAPNAGHLAVAAFQQRHPGRLTVITQNVDGLHQAAGSKDVVELHGSLDRVRCLSCGAISPRRELARRLEEANPGFEPVAAGINPDGDADLTDAQVGDFRVVSCAVCGGILKPDVVFFGEAVPPQRVEHCRELVGEAASLLVLGSSLTVMSGLRFVRQAAQAGKPVLIVNRDPTRGDPHALTRVALPLGTALTTVADRLDILVEGRAAA